MMRKEFKILALGIIASVIGLVFVANNFSLTPSTTSLSTASKGLTLTYHAVQCTYINGELWECSENLFTSAGQNATRNALFTDAVASGITAFEDIAIANKTGAGCAAALSVNDTTLCGEYTTCTLARTNVANAFKRFSDGNGSTNSASGNWTIGGEFTANAACDVNSTGLFNTTTASSGQPFAENTFTTASLANNDKINITWFIWVT